MKPGEYSYSFKRVEIIGYTTDVNKCQCCGKDNLNGTVRLRDLSSGEAFHFGTTCAVKANKYDDLQALAEAKREVSRVVNSVGDSIKFAHMTIRRMKLTGSVDEITAAYIKWAFDEGNLGKGRYNWERFA